MNKLMRHLFLSFLAALVFLLSSSPALAVQFRTGDNLIFSEGEKLDETYFIAGKQITFDSDLVGDLHCAGQSVIINGSIKGDILCVGQDIKINGSVDGNVRVAGQTVTVKGIIGRNLNVLSQMLTLDKGSSVKGDILFGVQTIDFSGNAGRDLAGAGESITISGSLFRNAMVSMNNLSISDTARIKGTLDYYIEKDSAASISSKSVTGEIRRHDYEIKNKPQKIEVVKEFSLITILATAIFGALAFFIVASALIYFDKTRTEMIINSIREKPFINMLIGLGVTAAFPFVFIILLSTLIGIPLAFLMLLVFITSMMISSVYSAIVIGWSVLKFFKHKTNNSFLFALIGVFVLGLIISVPLVGWLIGLGAYLSGLGALFVTFLPEKSK